MPAIQNPKHCTPVVLIQAFEQPLTLCCSPGETKTTVAPYILGGISDGQWHVVQIHYYNKVWRYAFGTGDLKTLNLALLYIVYFN